MEGESTRVALVVGGSGGIGSEVARILVGSGWKVVITGRDTGRLEEAASRTGAETAVLEARDSGAVDAVFQSVHQRRGRLDGVVHCAGSILLKPAHLISDAEFAETLATNLVTAFHVLRAAVRIQMRQPGGGSVVLCSSVAAQRGLVNHEAIAAAKAGVEGLVRSAAASYARFGIRVNGVAPGLTRTPLTRTLTTNEALSKASAALHPLGRLGEPGDVASAIAWLTEPTQGWITGQILGVDGGMAHVQARS